MKNILSTLTLRLCCRNGPLARPHRLCGQVTHGSGLLTAENLASTEPGLECNFGTCEIWLDKRTKLLLATNPVPLESALCARRQYVPCPNLAVIIYPRPSALLACCEARIANFTTPSCATSARPGNRAMKGSQNGKICPMSPVLRLLAALFWSTCYCMIP